MGRSLVPRCRADGYTVRVFDLPVCDFTGLEGEPGIEVVPGDITQMATDHTGGAGGQRRHAPGRHLTASE